jgi:hypothetical protein
LVLKPGRSANNGALAKARHASLIGQRFSQGPIWVAGRQGANVGTASVVPKGTALYVRSVAVLPRAGSAQVLAESFAAYEPARTPGAFAATTPGASVIEQRFSALPHLTPASRFKRSIRAVTSLSGIGIHATV